MYKNKFLINKIKNISNEFQWRLDAVEIYDWIGMVSIQAQRYYYYTMKKFFNTFN